MSWIARIGATKALFWAFVACAGLWAYLQNRDWVLPTRSTHDIAPAAINAEKERAYLVAIPKIHAGLESVLLEGVAGKREPLGFLQGALGWSRVHYYLNGLISRRFPDSARDIAWQPVGPGGQLHDDVRRLGNGRYSVWHGVLYFSSSDNSDPRANGRSYRLVVQPRVTPTHQNVLRITTVLLGASLLAIFMLRVPFIRTQMPGVVIALAMVGVIFAAAETYLRIKIPFLEPVRVSYLHPVAGFVMKAGEEMRHTNNADFWVRDKVNSMGFLDKEPRRPKPPGSFRILVLGDSFVEAAQVQIPNKFQVLLEAELRKAFPAKDVEVLAMGYSGTGQSNEISFYEAFGKEVAADLMLNVIVSNDVANNSPVLEAVRHGWHPYHPPRLFFEVDSGPSGFRRVEIDTDWEKHVFHKATADRYKDYATRIELLRQDPGIAPMLEGWRYPGDLDMDEMFCASEMPLVFRNAEASTLYAFKQLAEIGRKERIPVLLVTADNVSTFCQDGTSARTTSKGALIRKVRALAREAGLPVIDLEPAFAAKGDRTAARFAHDAHWSETGHRWVADALADHFKRNPALLARR